MEENKTPRVKLNFLAGLAGVLAVTAALLVLIGWHTHNTRLIQINPAFAPMQYNTALSFIFCGLAVLLIIFGKPSFALISSLIPLIFGGLTLSEYIFKINLGVDTIFIQPYIMVRASHLGRMAPNTAICFMIMGISLLLLLRLKDKRLCFKNLFLAIGILSAAVFNFGLVAFIGYLSGVPTAYGWGYFTQMAVHTSALFAALGLGIFLLALYECKDKTIYFHPVIPTLIFILLMLFTVSFQQAFLAKEQENINYIIKNAAEELPDVIVGHINERILALERMAGRWEVGGRPQKEHWQADAASYIAGYAGFQAIEWTDPLFKVRWIEPLKGNEGAQDADFIFEEQYRGVFENSRIQKKPAVISGVDLAQGSKGLLIGIPVFFKGEFDGFIVGIFRIQDVIDDILDEYMKSNFFINIFDAQELVYRNSPEGVEPKEKHSFEKEISFSGVLWKAHIYPAKKMWAILETPLDEIILFFGSLVALLFFCLARLLQRNKEFNLKLEETVIMRTQELQDANKVLQQSSERFALVTKATRSVTWDWNLLNDTIWWGDMFCNVFKCGVKEIGSDIKSWTSRIHPDDLKRVSEGIHAFIESGKQFWSDEYRFLREDGIYVWVEDHGYVIHDDAGKAVRMIGAMLDITEHKEVKDLKRIDQLKKDFLSNMSHELRTPLNAVIGFSEVLVDQKFGSLNETQKDYLNDILESGRFLLSMINDILDLAKIESGKMELTPSDFSLRELLEHSLIFVKEKALRHNIELSLEIAQEVGDIRADERKVRQIIFNLLSNAVKFTPDGGKVGIKAEIKGIDAQITVWDTGIGISKEDQAKLFRPFMQIESPLAKKYEGTGLGLSLVKDLVDLHKGKIWVESEGKGRGSSFTFSLPRGEV